MLHILSTAVLILIACGLRYRRTPRIHLMCVITAFAVDLSLVIYIEATRHAVEQVATHIRALLWFHAGVSLSVLACYGILMFLGLRMLKGRKASRTTHRNLGMTFVVLRLLNYVTAFAV